jgi:replicative DNA helicase Mcm
VQTLAPKGIYVSGKSVTGVGLTAAAEKDESGEGGWTLKAGALVIASGGIAGVDEFDKIDDTERAAMHEVMESQQVSVAKAGIVARFKAKTAILAAANPKFGRFDPNKLPGLQFDIPPTILSRFDLIFPIIDVLDEAKDSALAEHLLSMHKSAAESGGKPVQQQTGSGSEGESLYAAFLRKYVAYARQNIKPVLSQEAMDKIKTYYVELRRRGKAEGAVPITPRQIEGLVRMSEASAKVRLSNAVELADAERAIRLTDYVLDKVSRDRETGKLDIDILATGRPKSQVDKINTLLNLAAGIQRELGVVEINRLVEQATGQNIDEVTARRLIDDLIYKGELYKVKPGFVKLVEQGSG